ncbi:MAG: ComF family protein [Candidatus Staskawiczbacteria bacterium]|nr:ComF family protein [Candidatus Staskawiczbacteria bacterium]
MQDIQKINNQKGGESDSFNKFSKGLRGLGLLAAWLEDLFFPKFCLGCQKEGAYLCGDCRHLLDISEFNYCLCDRPAKLLTTQENRLPGKCSKCQDKKLSGLYFALSYKDNSLTQKLIYQFKYQPYLKDLAKTLASILIEHFVLAKNNTDEIWENSVLIPVPIHIKKLRERGYNQSEELAKELSKVLNVPVVSNVLVKTKSTKPQMELKKEEREKNLENAFEINPVRNGISNGVKNLFLNKKVFLVDDVYTTGSTMNECTLILRNSGAKSVWGIAVAREE